MAEYLTALLRKADFTDFPAGNLTLDQDDVETKDKFTFIAKYKIPKGVGAALGHLVAARDLKVGYGSGILCTDFYDSTPTSISGSIRLIGSDPTRTKSVILYDGHTSSFTPATPTNPDINPVLVTRVPWILEDGYLEIWFKADVDDTVLDGTQANFIQIPITKKLDMRRPL